MHRTCVCCQDEVDAEVKVLLALKAQYKALTGEDLAGGGQGRKGGKGAKKAPEADKNKQQQPKQEKKQEEKTEGAAGDREVKKVTRWFIGKFLDVLFFRWIMPLS